MVPQKPGDYIPAPPAACSQGRGGRPGFRQGQVSSFEQVGLWPSPVPSQKVSQFLITPPLINTVTPWAGAKGKHREQKPLEVSSVSDPHSAPAGRNCPIPPHSHHSVPAAGQDWGLFPADLGVPRIRSGGKCNIFTCFPLNPPLSCLWLHQNTGLGAGPNVTCKRSSLLALGNLGLEN